MIQHEQVKPISVDEPLESVRQLRAQDADGFRRLVDAIGRDATFGLSEDVLALARSLKYTDAELLEAVDSFGLVRTFGHLRREAEKPKRTDIAKSPVMVH